MFPRHSLNARKLVITELIGVTYNIEEQLDYLSNYGVTSTNNSINSLGSSINLNTNSINSLGISSSNLESNKLDKHQSILPSNFIISSLQTVGNLGTLSVLGDVNFGGNLVGTTAQIQNINVSGTFQSPLTNLIGTSIINLQSTDNFLQNQINSIVIAGISAGNIDIMYGVSIAILDSHFGDQIGITNISLNQSIINLNTTTSTNTNNITVLNSNVVNLNTTTSNLGISLNTLSTNFGISSTIFGTSYNNLEIHKQDQIQCSISFNEISNDIDITNLNVENLKTIVGAPFSFIGITVKEIIYGTTQTLDSDGLEPESFTKVVDVIDRVQLGIDLLKDGYNLFIAGQTLYNNGQTAYNNYMNGYQALQDTAIVNNTETNAAQTTQITVLQASAVATATNLVVLNTLTGIHSTDISDLGTSSDNNSTSIGTLYNRSNSVGISSLNLDTKVGTIIGTSIPNVDTKIGIIIGVSLPNVNVKISNVIGTSIPNLDNKIGSIIGTSIPNLDTKIGSIIGVSIPNLDTKIGTIIGVSIPNITNQINSISTSTNILNSNIINLNTTTNILNSNIINLSTSIGTSTNTLNNQIIVLTTTSTKFLQRNENILPNTFTSSSLTSLGVIQNLIATTATITNFKVTNSILSTTASLNNLTCNNVFNTNGSQYIQANTGNNDLTTFANNYFIKNLTGVTSYLQITGTTFGINSLATNITGNLSVTGNITGNTINSIGVSFVNVDLKVGNLIGVTVPKILQRNEAILPSTFTSSSLTSVGTLNSLNIAGNCVVGAGLSNNNPLQVYGQSPYALMGLYLSNSNATFNLGANTGSYSNQINMGMMTTTNAGFACTPPVSLLFQPNGNNNTYGMCYMDGSGIGINNVSPSYTLDVNGDINTNSNFKINGTTVLSSGTITSIGTSISVIDGKNVVLGVTVSNVDIKTAALGISVSNVDIKTAALGISVSNVDIKTAALGISVSTIDIKTAALGTSVSNTVNYGTTITNVITNVNTKLDKTATSLPSSFVSSSLTSVGTLSSLNVAGGTVIGSGLSTNPPLQVFGQSPYALMGLYLSNSNATFNLGANTGGYGNQINMGMMSTVNAGFACTSPVSLLFQPNGNSNTYGMCYMNGSGVGINNKSPSYTLDINGDTNISSGNGYRVNGNVVLNSNTLGNGILSSSLTSVGTLNSLNVAGDLNNTGRILIDSNDANTVLHVNASDAARPCMIIGSPPLSSVLTLQTQTSHSTGDYLQCTLVLDLTNPVFKIDYNGSCYNQYNVYSSISDIKLKENIKPVKNFTEKFKQIEFVNYNLIDDVNKVKQIGVIAQQLETLFPNLIENHLDPIHEDLIVGDLVEREYTKSVKYSVLNLIGLKVLQDLIERIENLENK